MFTLAYPEGVLLFAETSCACPPDQHQRPHVCTNACTSWVYVVSANPLIATGWLRVRAGTAARAFAHKENGFVSVVPEVIREIEHPNEPVPAITNDHN